MNKSISALSICLAITTFAAAQVAQPNTQTKTPEAADKLPTVDQVIEKYVQSIGGRRALEKVTSRVSKGTMEIPAFNATVGFELYAKAPDKLISSSTFPGFGVVLRGFDGKVAWTQNPQRGLREMSGNEAAEMKRDADFYGDLNLREHYPRMTLKGSEKVGDREAWLIDAVPTEGGPVRMYFDVQSGLLVRIDSELERPNGHLSASVFYDDYRDVDGARLPYTIRQLSDALTFTIRLQEVKQNVPIDDNKFNKPAGE